MPYRGGAPAVVDLLAGQVQLVFAPISEVIQHIKAGKLRPLAVTPASKLSVLPDVPTVGSFLPGYEASGFAGIGVPKGTPSAIIDLLNKELNAALADPKIGGRIIELGGTPVGGTPRNSRRSSPRPLKSGEGHQVREHQDRLAGQWGGSRMARALDFEPLNGVTFGAVVRGPVVTDLDEARIRHALPGVAETALEGVVEE